MDFHAKILLFGEYGILLGSMGLALPYPRFAGRFRFPEDDGTIADAKADLSHGELRKLMAFLKREPSSFSFLELDRFEADMNRGLYFDSTIPQGSGLGSSGALTAALFARYAANSRYIDNKEPRSRLAAIESCFHGRSSGIDPLIPLLNRPLLINPEPAGITVVNPAKFLNSCTLFLIDSRTTGKTSNLVAGFLAQYREQAGFRQAVDGAFIPTVNGIIESVLTADFKAFDPLMARYSEFQLDRLPHLIPTGMRKYFVRGIETGEFFLKICGSGGGGFVLGFSRDRVKAENYFKENHLDYFIV